MQMVLDILSNFFISVFNMSITASVIIAFVFLARLCLKRMPRGFSYALWAVVLFRLLCPVSFELPFAALSLTGASPADAAQMNTMQYIQADWMLRQNKTDSAIDTPADTGNASEGAAVVPNESTTATTQDIEIVGESAQGVSFNTLTVVSAIWMLGAVGLFGANCFSLLRLKKKLRPALRYGGETYAALAETPIYQSDAIPTAFVLGGLKPCIFLPMHLSMQEQSYILRHEQVHIARRDHLWQALAFLALCLHWFNPLVWFAFKANQKDMELSCDERVLRQMGNGIKKEYAQSLLNLSQGRNPAMYSVLAFGENDATSRIKNVLSYRKPMLWVSLFANVALIIAVVLLVANPIAEIDANATADDVASQTVAHDSSTALEPSAMPTATPMPTLDPLAVAGVYTDQDISFTYPTDWQVVGDIDAALKIYCTADELYSFTIAKGHEPAVKTSDMTSLLYSASSESDTFASVTLFETVGGYDAAVSEIYLQYTVMELLKRLTYQMVVDGASYTITMDMRASSDFDFSEIPEQDQLYAILDSIAFTVAAPQEQEQSLTEMQVYQSQSAEFFYYPTSWNMSIAQYDDFQIRTVFDENASLVVNTALSVYDMFDITSEGAITRVIGAVVTDLQLSEITVSGVIGTQATYTFTGVDGVEYQGRWVLVSAFQNDIPFDFSYRYAYRSDVAEEYQGVLDDILAQVEY